MKNKLLKFSSIFGVFALCGLLCSSFLFNKKEVNEVSADVSQDLLISRYIVDETGYRIVSQSNADYSVWLGYAVDFRWYYNGANGYYLKYSMPADADDIYSTSHVGYYYDSSWYYDMRGNNPVAERYLCGFYIDYNFSNDGTILWNPHWYSTSSSINYVGMNGGWYTENPDVVGTHGGEGIYWDTPFKFVYCYLTKFNYLGMTDGGTYARYEVEYTYTMSREDGSVYVFTNYFTALSSDCETYQTSYLNQYGEPANPYSSLNNGYSNYDKISFNGNFLLWSHEFDLVDLPPNYADGYNTGYEDGYQDGYDNGYDDALELNEQAYDNGFNAGVSSVENQLNTYYQDGYTAGYNVAIQSNQTVATIFSNILLIGMLPVDFFLRILNFEVLGINVASFITALLSVALTIIVIRLVTGKKND